MLINTSRGTLINTGDRSDAIERGKIGYLGIEVYEFDKDIFYEDQHPGKIKDAVLLKLLTYPHVIMTPHQAFLTGELCGK